MLDVLASRHWVLGLGKWIWRRVCVCVHFPPVNFEKQTKVKEFPTFYPQVIRNSKTNLPELELFPRYLLFLRQQPATRTQQSNIWVNMGMMSLRMFPHNLPRGNVRIQQEPHSCIVSAARLAPPPRLPQLFYHSMWCVRGYVLGGDKLNT